MRRLLALLSVALLVLAVTGTATATPGEDHKITICHATNSLKNPWVEITIDDAAWEAEGPRAHSSTHHVNKRTGEGDFVLLSGTCDDGPGDDGPGG